MSINDTHFAPPPIRTPMVDEDGFISPPWSKWLAQGMYQRVGGGNSITLDQLEAITAAGETRQRKPEDPGGGGSDESMAIGGVVSSLEDLARVIEANPQPFPYTQLIESIGSLTEAIQSIRQKDSRGLTIEDVFGLIDTQRSGSSSSSSGGSSLTVDDVIALILSEKEISKKPIEPSDTEQTSIPSSPKILNLIPGRVPFATNGGHLTDSAGLTFSSGNLYCQGAFVAGTGTNVFYAGAIVDGAAYVDTSTYGLVLRCKGGIGADFALVNAGATGLIFYVIPGTSDVRFNGKIGFNASAPIARPTVTGSRGGNAALASLLTALSNYGLITDSTTA